jgi:SGNH domain (fused to AT3 domains)
VIADVPRTTGKSIPNCLAEAEEDDPDACTTSISDALLPDAMARAARKMKGDGVLLLDLTRYFCVDEVCRPRIGQVIVCSDASHLTKTYARTLAPFIEPTLIATGTD